MASRASGLLPRLQMVCRRPSSLPVSRWWGSKRYTATEGRAALQLGYAQHGSPREVMRLEACPTGDVGPSSVVVQMLAAPINPADINQIEGVYPKKPTLPAVGGNEGVGEVMAVGKDVDDLIVGDRVVKAGTDICGTWRTHCTATQDNWLKVPGSIPIHLAATMSVNPCTAYRMLRDFVELQPGETIIQNGANSGCGQAVIQLAREMGVRTINVVRDRENVNELKSYLSSIGATAVLTEQELTAAGKAGALKEYGPIRLGLNCVGGRSATGLVRQLAPRGTLVTYGGMSKKPVMVPTGSLIFHDLSFRGFWMTRWNQEASREQRQTMMNEISRLLEGGSLQLVCATPACSKGNA